MKLWMVGVIISLTLCGWLILKAKEMEGDAKLRYTKKVKEAARIASGDIGEVDPDRYQTPTSRLVPRRSVSAADEVAIAMAG